MRFKIQLLGVNDAAVLQRVAPGVFDGPVDPRSTAEFLADAPHHIVVAITQQHRTPPYCPD